MLTAKGKLAYKHHAEFHKQMTEALVEGLDPEETKLLVRALTSLKNFFEEYAKGQGRP